MANTLIQNLKSKASDVRVYWNIPMPGRYMTFKEIAAYAGGGIGAYFLITVGSTLIVNAQNMIVGGAIGISPTHMYILYIIATIASIPLTAIRANMIDNSKNRAGKYRPYLISMGIPTALIAIAYVWFPYEYLDQWFPSVAYTDPKTGAPILMGYLVKCLVVLVLNFFLQFYFSFFNDSYTNLIHVLSPNTQERTDVLSIKSVVYSLAPSIANIVLPLIAQAFTNDDMYDIRVYRIGYPIFAVLGFALSCIVYVNTKEKIVQAKTRVVQVRFIDAFKAVAKNKYFWIIALAGWLGFLEGAYGQIMSWVYTYGHATTGTVMGIINTVVGNASMWGMIIAPFCIRAFGKKKVLIGVNFMNILCILAMGLNRESIYWLAVCVYFNWLFGAFEQITTPAIQADIRDYHQYITGERIDGMFSTVQTIGNIVTLVTSLVLPLIYESYGIYQGNGYDSPYDILDVTTGEPGLLSKVTGTLILMAAFGAFLNMVPYFFYDLKEVQQKSIVRILKIRAMFEDYGNGVTNSRTLVEAVEFIRKARELAGTEEKVLTKADRKADKKAYKAAKELNEEIAIAKAVNEELNKFESGIYKIKYEANLKVYQAGLMGLYNLSKEEICNELKAAREMPKSTAEEKELRKFAIEIANKKLSARKAIDKYYKTPDTFVMPKYDIAEALFEKEDNLDAELKQLYLEQAEAKKAKESFRLKEISDRLKEIKAEKKEVQKAINTEMAKHTNFNRASKPYVDAERIVKEKENFQHIEELEAKYEESKAALEAALAAELEEQKRLDAEKAEKTRQLKEEKAAAKMSKKNK